MIPALQGVEVAASSGFVVDLPDAPKSLSYVNFSPGNAYVGARFKSDGSADLQRSASGSWYATDPWGLPVTTGVGSGYDIRATLNSGTSPSGSAVGSWLNLATTRYWQLVETGIGTKACNLTIEIRDAVSLTLLDTQTYSLDATVELGA